jgi:GNAT superfamily N-acetyltransferase
MDQTAIIDAYWAEFLGVEPSALRTEGTTVVEHHRLGQYSGVWFFARDSAVVVSAPSAQVDRLSNELRGVPHGELLTAHYISELFGGFEQKIIGPSFQGWLPPGALRQQANVDVHRVQGIEPFAEAVRKGCSEEEWSHSGVDVPAGEAWVGFREKRPVALGQLRQRLGACDPCVVTHRDYRGQGFGTRIVSSMLQQRDSKGSDVVLYQTLLSNAGAISIAEKLGFEEYATLIAVRLGEGAF